MLVIELVNEQRFLDRYRMKVINSERTAQGHLYDGESMLHAKASDRVVPVLKRVAIAIVHSFWIGI